MSRTDQGKLLGVVLVTIASLWLLYPSYQYYTMSPTQRQAMDTAKLGKLRKKAIHLGLDLQGGMQLLLEVDKSRLSPAEAKDAVERAREIINNRIDQFGVAEPLIQIEGQDRIAVQLPGLTDPERAKELIGKTALLEFKLVRSADEQRTLYQRLDSWLAARRIVPSTDSALAKTPLTGLMIDNGFFRKEDVPTVQKLLATTGIDSLVPTDTQLLWGGEDEARSGMTGRSLYVLKKDAELTGGSVASAEAAVGLESTNPGAWGVSMKMTPKGRADFARVTGNNVGRQLAIILDGVVQSAPFIRDRIPSGDASITGGSFDVNTARDLAIVLRAGALPVKLNFIEERTVGPTLGQDSLKRGLTASLVGLGISILFLVVYYKLSGALAAFGLALNMFIVLAVMAAFHAALSLPGIAGLVLSVAMAVDANVLIFERIREELRKAKTVSSAIEAGYKNAFSAIFDSNLTTVFSGIVLLYFGTGPVKGFAVTLCIGITVSMFTALFVTRFVYDALSRHRKMSSLSI